MSILNKEQKEELKGRKSRFLSGSKADELLDTGDFDHSGYIRFERDELWDGDSGNPPECYAFNHIVEIDVSELEGYEDQIPSSASDYGSDVWVGPYYEFFLSHLVYAGLDGLKLLPYLRSDREMVFKTYNGIQDTMGRVSIGYVNLAYVEFHDLVPIADRDNTYTERNDSIFEGSDGLWYASRLNMPREHPPSYYMSNISGASPYEAKTLREGRDMLMGFEIEKEFFVDVQGCPISSENGSLVMQGGLFASFVRDASCGVEARTHAISVYNRGYLEEQMEDINNRAIICSPINSRCGGHITVSRNFAMSSFIQDIISRSGLILCIWEERLLNSYVTGSITEKGRRRLQYLREGSASKYFPIRLKGRTVEFRMPPAIQNVDDLMWRFDLFSAFLKGLNKDYDENLEDMVELIDPVMDPSEYIDRVKTYQDYIDMALVKKDVAYLEKL